MRRHGIGEIVSAAIILGATAVVATIMLGVFSESAQVITDDARSRLDRMRAEAVEQLDITSISCSPGQMSFLVVNFGDYKSTLPFLAYDDTGIPIPNTTSIRYSYLGNSTLADCTGNYCRDVHGNTLARYDRELGPGASAWVEVSPWVCSNTLYMITDTGGLLRVTLE